MEFRVLPSGHDDIVNATLRNLTVPACLTGAEGALTSIDLTIKDGRLTEPDPAVPQIDMRGAMVFPAFTDMHTHIDKGHIWGRAPNPDGTFDGALATVGADRIANWSAEDVRARADFALRCAYAHGTRALRTHVDSLAPQAAISFPVMSELREAWAGRIELQASALIGADRIDQGAEFTALADLVAEHGGVLGSVTYPMPDLPTRLRDFFAAVRSDGMKPDEDDPNYKTRFKQTVDILPRKFKPKPESETDDAAAGEVEETVGSDASAQTGTARGRELN